MALIAWGGVCPLVRANVVAPPAILYLSSGSGDIALDLEPADTEGFYFTGCEALTTVEVDGRQVPHNITLDGGDRAVVNASFSGLEDGRHKAAAESPGSVEKGPSRREVLFIVDSEPPEVELIEPETGELQPTQNAFVVRCRDAGVGVSPDLEESELVVRINGREGQGLATSEGNDLVFVIHDNTNRWDMDQTISLHVSVKDRAGNQGILDIDFQVDAPGRERIIETIECEDEQGDLRKRSWYVPHRDSFPLSTSINWIRFDETVREVRGFLGINMSYGNGLPLDRDLFHSLEEAVEIVADHPCIRVERLQPSPDTPGVDFRVSQVCLPQDDKPLESITIKYPEAYISDWFLECPDSESESLITKLTPDGPIKSLSIPVFFHSEGGDYSGEIRVVDDRVIYRVAFSGAGGLDTSTSWFEMGGTRLWFSEKEQGIYEASMPVTEEGLQSYTTRLVLSGLRRAWGEDQEGETGDGGRSLLMTGEILVALDPPQIDHFHYDRENECFRAMVSDQGTAPEDLVLELITSGNVTPHIIFDPETGMVEAPYPMPTGIHAGLLKVTDLAGQTTTATCQVFGNTPPSQTVEDSHAEYPVTVKETHQSCGVWPKSPPNQLITREPLGVYKDNKELVKICHIYRHAVINRYPSRTDLDRLDKYVPGVGWASGIKLSTHGEWRKDCEQIWWDTKPPRIRNLVFLPSEMQVSALIDDHGMPLSELRISYELMIQSPHIYYSGSVRRPFFTFDTKTGLFVGKTFVRGEDPELFNLSITATDAAGNRGRGQLDVTLPNRPPDVSIDVLEVGPLVYPFGYCYDYSGIDHRKTKAWLDGRRVSLVGGLYGQWWGKNNDRDRLEFGPVTEEGPHVARLEVSDFAGLTSEASIAFQISIPPKIEDFRHLPLSLQRAGGPAFSAIIRDSGNDLYLDGIELTVDGVPVDRARFYFDRQTGYFAADGPLDLSPGMHVARIFARDAHGNSDEAFLSFIPGERIDLAGVKKGDLSIEDVTLWELQEHNGDGKANPGETIRLFVGLINHRYARLTDVRGRLRADEPGIVVERDEVSFGDLKRGETVTPMHGFDIRIDDNFLDKTISDPHDAQFTLEATDRTGKTWLLDFRVPVYRPTIPFNMPPGSPGKSDAAKPDPISEVTVAIESLPANTEEAQIKVSGTAVSTASIIDRVIVRVNGAMHTADWDPVKGAFSASVNLALGDNLIEAEAVDRTGAIGVDMGFIHRSEPYMPPEIEITWPPQGADFENEPVLLQGVFNAGSSQVNAFQAFLTWEGGSLPVAVVYSDQDGTFEGELVFPTDRRTTYTVTVILTTMGGDVVEDSVTFTWWIPS